MNLEPGIRPRRSERRLMQEGRCRVVLAETIAQLDDATRIRCDVFAAAMDLGLPTLPSLREINGYDVLPTTHVFVAYDGAKAVGTLRLTLPNADLAKRHAIPIGLPAAVAWDLRAVPPTMRLVELNRVAVVPDYRGRSVVGRLYAAACAHALANGHTHWLGTTLTGTDDARDAAIVAAVMAQRGGVAPAPRLVSRQPVPSHVPRRPIFGDSAREGAGRGDYGSIRLSAALRFHLRTEVKVIGDPLYDEMFGEYLVPVVVDLEALRQSAFGLLHFDEILPRPGTPLESEQGIVAQRAVSC